MMFVFAVFAIVAVFFGLYYYNDPIRKLEAEKNDRERYLKASQDDNMRKYKSQAAKMREEFSIFKQSESIQRLIKSASQCFDFDEIRKYIHTTALKKREVNTIDAVVYDHTRLFLGLACTEEALLGVLCNDRDHVNFNMMQSHSFYGNSIVLNYNFRENGYYNQPNPTKRGLLLGVFTEFLVETICKKYEIHRDGFSCSIHLPESFFVFQGLRREYLDDGRQREIQEIKYAEQLIAQINIDIAVTNPNYISETNLIKW